MTTAMEATKKSANRLDEMMTPAQIARRKFKSTLPRKIHNRRLTAMEALSQVFDLFDRFRGAVVNEGLDSNTILAGLVYCLPETNPSLFADTIRLPDPSEIVPFCEKVAALDRPLFLGTFFLQLDPDAKKVEHAAVVFCAQFLGGAEAEARLLYARKQLQATGI